MLPLTRDLARKCSEALGLLGRSFDIGHAEANATEGARLAESMRADLVRARFALANR
jgi:hypothetical protein